VSIRIRRRGEAETSIVSGAALINSSGIEYDWRRVARPLPQQLLARGLVRPGPLALGIAAAVDGAVLGADEQAASRLFAMGPPLRGMWWESTAVTDVASQAKALAARLTTTPHLIQTDTKPYEKVSSGSAGVELHDSAPSNSTG
jgi:uncharacterized NAD(P)/FAD-binding protein YdhS